MISCCNRRRRATVPCLLMRASQRHHFHLMLSVSLLQKRNLQEDKQTLIWKIYGNLLCRFQIFELFFIERIWLMWKNLAKSLPNPSLWHLLFVLATHFLLFNQLRWVRKKKTTFDAFIWLQNYPKSLVFNVKVLISVQVK